MPSTTPLDVSVTLDLATPDAQTLASLMRALPAGSSVGRSAWSDRLVINTTSYYGDERAAQAVEHAVYLARHALMFVAVECDGDVDPAAPMLAVEALAPQESERRIAAAEQPTAYVSATEAADLLGVSAARIRQRAQDGELGAIKVGAAGWALRKDLVEREAKA